MAIQSEIAISFHFFTVFNILITYLVCIVDSDSEDWNQDRVLSYT